MGVIRCPPTNMMKIVLFLAVVCGAALCLYEESLGAADACGRLGYCPAKSQTRDWTCEECEEIMGRVAAFMAEEETIQEAITFLQGECFCGAPGHTEDCPALINTILPQIVPVLSSVLQEQTDELCQDIVGVC